MFANPDKKLLLVEMQLLYWKMFPSLTSTGSWDILIEISPEVICHTAGFKVNTARWCSWVPALLQRTRLIHWTCTTAVLVVFHTETFKKNKKSSQLLSHLQTCTPQPSVLCLAVGSPASTLPIGLMMNCSHPGWLPFRRSCRGVESTSRLMLSFWGAVALSGSNVGF